MKSSVVITSKLEKGFKKRLDLSHQPQSLKIPHHEGRVLLKMVDDKIKWSSNNGKTYKSTERNCPLKITSVHYPKIELEAKKSSSKVLGYQYCLVDKKTKAILATKVYRKKVDMDEKKATKFFSRSVVLKKHKIKVLPVYEHLKVESEKDPYSHQYLSPFKDKRMGAAISLILTLWMLNFAYINFIKNSEKEATLVQLEDKQEILKEREHITQLLSAHGDDPKNQRTSEKLKSVVSKVESKKGKEPKKTGPKRVQTISNTKTKSRTKVARAGGASKTKKTGAPSLKDRLFSREIKRGSIGRASSRAQETLRGSAKGSSKGTYGSSQGIRGGYAKGSGASLSASVGARASGNGTGTSFSGGGFGDLGSRVMLSGKGANVSGGLTREQISKVVRRNKKDINRCYENRLQFSPDLSGQVMMNFLIDGSGRVLQSQAGKSSLNDQALESCIARKIKGWRFDKPVNGRKVQVSYPFNLTFNKRG